MLGTSLKRKAKGWKDGKLKLSRLQRMNVLGTAGVPLPGFLGWCLELMLQSQPACWRTKGCVASSRLSQRSDDEGTCVLRAGLSRRAKAMTSGFFVVRVGSHHSLGTLGLKHK